MIRQIRGVVAKVEPERIVIDVGGVGYLVHTTVVAADFKVGEETLLYTYLAVRENALDLYGFIREDELTMFELLIDLPKIGPKSALGVMSQADCVLIEKAVAENDAEHLSKMSGIGKKTAEKIVMGLKDKLDAYQERDTASGAHTGSDIIDALITLGYSQKDARDAAQKIPSDITDTRTQIKEALKLLSR